MARIGGRSAASSQRGPASCQRLLESAESPALVPENLPELSPDYGVKNVCCFKLVSLGVIRYVATDG